MISIIIPTYNESDSIGPLIQYLLDAGGPIVDEIIVSDGGSQDDTCERAARAGALLVKSPQKGRAAQMNHGAAEAKSAILYFVHADCFPPASFARDILSIVGKD